MCASDLSFHCLFSDILQGGFAARKALSVVTNVETVLAIELLCACQALSFLRPLKSTVPLEEVCTAEVSASYIMFQSDSRPFCVLRQVHKTVRSKVAFWEEDNRVMSTDIEECVKLLRGEAVWNAVSSYIDPKLHEV